jgi:hypothetical protein
VSSLKCIFVAMRLCLNSKTLVDLKTKSNSVSIRPQFSSE